MKFKKIITNNNTVKKYSESIKSFIIKIKNLINKSEKNKNLLKDIKNISLILFLSFLFLIIWVNRVKLYPENVLIWIKGKTCSFANFKKNFPCQIEGEKVASENFKIFDGKIMVLSDNSLNVMDTFGNIIRNEKHSFSNPCLKLGNVRSIIYDRGGKNFKIESLSENLYSGTCEKDIIACAISDNGIYAIVNRSISHLAEVKIYNKRYKEKYFYAFSEHYISDVSLNSSGNEASLCGIEAENGNINSAIYVLDFKSEKPKFQFKLENNTVTHIEYISENNIIAIGDKYISFINLKSKSIKNYSYENKILKFYDFNKNDGICCCFSSSVNEPGNDEIVMINSAGKELFKTKTSETLLGISHRGSKTAAITSDKIILFNFYGKSEGYVKTKNHENKIILLPYSQACVLGAGKVDKIKLSSLNKNTNLS